MDREKGEKGRTLRERKNERTIYVCVFICMQDGIQWAQKSIARNIYLI